MDLEPVLDTYYEFAYYEFVIHRFLRGANAQAASSRGREGAEMTDDFPFDLRRSISVVAISSTPGGPDVWIA
ncbi:MAG: hypothetical protein ACIAQ0_12420 [Phycisphaerales bacterium JB058]